VKLTNGDCKLLNKQKKIGVGRRGLRRISSKLVSQKNLLDFGHSWSTGGALNQREVQTEKKC